MKSDAGETKSGTVFLNMLLGFSDAAIAAIHHRDFAIEAKELRGRAYLPTQAPSTWIDCPVR
jgi:hypothetical protein